MCVYHFCETYDPRRYNSEIFTYMEWMISSRMAQVPFFYSLTLTIIFKVKPLAFSLFYEYLVNGERCSKDFYCHQIGSHAFAIGWCHCEYYTSYILRSRIFKCEYIENGESERKFSSMTFTDIDRPTCHRIGHCECCTL